MAAIKSAPHFQINHSQANEGHAMQYCERYNETFEADDACESRLETLKTGLEAAKTAWLAELGPILLQYVSIDSRAMPKADFIATVLAGVTPNVNDGFSDLCTYGELEASMLIGD
jgi:hypothetical protein